MTNTNNLNQSLAPISDLAWQQIEEEAARTFKRNLAGRRVVDVKGPLGFDYPAVATGHVAALEPVKDGIITRVRTVLPIVELRVPFSLLRSEIDDVARGAQDSDWQPVKDAAAHLAAAEDQLVFEGLSEANVAGVGPLSSNEAIPLSADPKSYPDAVAHAESELRLAGVEGPYSLVLDAAAYTAVSETRDSGYPIRTQLEKIVSGDIVWAPAITGGFLMSTRGGDYELSIGQDFSIGYLRHTDSSVDLYLQETVTFNAITAEAAVPLLR